MKTRVFKLAVSIILAGAICFSLSTCKKEKTEDEQYIDVEITEDLMRGTWEGEFEGNEQHGPEKYRVTFDGNKYKMWNTRVATLRVDGESKKCTVGCKNQGTWEYSGGCLVFTRTDLWFSYQATQTEPIQYTVSSYDTETMEADPWYKMSDSAVDQLYKTQMWWIKTKNTYLEATINNAVYKFKKIL